VLFAEWPAGVAARVARELLLLETRLAAEGLGPTSPKPPSEATGGNPMLWTIFVVLLVLWLLGMVSSYTLGGFIHLLLILAVGMLLINVIQGRRIT
jgi:hypothetical protein